MSPSTSLSKAILLPSGDHTGVRPTADRPPSTPRWVKVFGIIALVLVVLFVISLLAGVGIGVGTTIAWTETTRFDSSDAGDIAVGREVARRPRQHQPECGQGPAQLARSHDASSGRGRKQRPPSSPEDDGGRFAHT